MDTAGQFSVKSLLVAALSMLLSGCSQTPYYKSEQQSPAQIQADAHTTMLVNADLNQAAQKVAVSLSQLAEIEKANYQGNLGLPFQNINDSALNQTIALYWYGPIAPVLKGVADRVGYQLQVYGKAPQTPILVNLDTTATSTSALAILRNLDLQAGQNADIEIYPDTKIISLRYLGT